jgi:outer membrane protein assembly factor BamB
MRTEARRAASGAPQARQLALRRHTTRALIAAALAALAAVVLAAPHAAQAAPAWTTYHHDATRTGQDPDGTTPLNPALAWQSPNLGAPMWNQPLILGGVVYSATIGDDVYALDASTGAIIWHASAGTPVPSSKLPCGDVVPTVGIVSTPVIDPATGVIYVVADTWNGSEAQHLLEGFRLSDGARVVATPVDPPGADPKAILQRSALNLNNGNVIFGFGGNDGDCSVYKGAVVSAPENGGPPAYWQVPIAKPSTGGGAVWATGGPAVDSAGNIYAATGNPNPPAGKKATTFDDSDAVVSLNSADQLTGWFEPPTWEVESNSDLDLGSAAPELLPGGLLFQAGKTGTGYLIDTATMSGGAAAVYSHQVCNGAGSFGGDSYAAGVIYIPCTNGTMALSYDATARTFLPLWQAPSDAVGPPILSAGIVWTVATGGFSGGGTKLYGLDPASGKPRYTLTLPSPVTDHFASPSAAGGRLFVSTGSTVTAFQTAVLTPLEGPAPIAPAASPTAQGAVLPTLLGSHLHAGQHGFVKLRLRCSAGHKCRGTVRLDALFTRKLDGHAHTITIPIGHASFGAHQGTFTLRLRLNATGRALLRRHAHLLHVVVTVSLSGAASRHTLALLRG